MQSFLKALFLFLILEYSFLNPVSGQQKKNFSPSTNDSIVEEVIYEYDTVVLKPDILPIRRDTIRLIDTIIKTDTIIRWYPVKTNIGNWSISVSPSVKFPINHSLKYDDTTTSVSAPKVNWQLSLFTKYSLKHWQILGTIGLCLVNERLRTNRTMYWVDTTSLGETQLKEVHKYFHNRNEFLYLELGLGFGYRFPIQKTNNSFTVTLSQLYNIWKSTKMVDNYGNNIDIPDEKINSDLLSLTLNAETSYPISKHISFGTNVGYSQFIKRYNIEKFPLNLFKQSLSVSFLISYVFF
jgi:hypothetical protein